jgi:hypothetical protein
MRIDFIKIQDGIGGESVFLVSAENCHFYTGNLNMLWQDINESRFYRYGALRPDFLSEFGPQMLRLVLNLKTGKLVADI